MRMHDPPKGEIMTQLLNLIEAAKMLRIHRITLRRHIAEGSIPMVKVGRRVLIKETDLEAFIANRTVVLAPVFQLEEAK